jgi:hypothetical protein
MYRGVPGRTDGTPSDDDDEGEPLQDLPAPYGRRPPPTISQATGALLALSDADADEVDIEAPAVAIKAAPVTVAKQSQDLMRKTPASCTRKRAVLSEFPGVDLTRYKRPLTPPLNVSQQQQQQPQLTSIETTVQTLPGGTPTFMSATETGLMSPFPSTPSTIPPSPSCPPSPGATKYANRKMENSFLNYANRDGLRTIDSDRALGTPPPTLSPRKEPFNTFNSKLKIMGSLLPLHNRTLSGGSTGKFTSKLGHFRTNSAASQSDSSQYENADEAGGGGLSNSNSNKSTLIRRFNVGERVLVANNNNNNGWIKLVNKHGYPAGEGTTPPERQGPYKYVIATVRDVHFDEVQPYYTVARADTVADTEQRADAECMEPLRSAQGEQAAFRAATTSVENHIAEVDTMDYYSNADIQGPGVLIKCVEYVVFVVLIPCLWLFDCSSVFWLRHVRPCLARAREFSRHHGGLILNGTSPYTCPIRMTMVNVIVLCSTWYMFIDQARLALLPPSADNAVAMINLCVWVILVLELLVEVFIRPDGYKNLIVSDKAYSPKTVRYIHAFHVIVETLSLLLFVPEFYCVLSASKQCDDRLAFSTYNALLLVNIGPGRRQTFYGHAFFALIRLRIFGLVRHWRNMWIKNTFITMKWTEQNTKGFGSLVPLAAKKRRTSELAFLLESTTAKTDPEAGEQQQREAALTNASTIGTALMVTNSYRALVLLWMIIGVFPIVFCIVSTRSNPVALLMTKQMLGTNIIAADASVDGCHFLAASVWAWVTAVSRPGKSSQSTVPNVLALDIAPKRCPFQLRQDIIQGYCNDLSLAIAATQSAGARYSLDQVAVLEYICQWWSQAPSLTIAELSRTSGKRRGSILYYNETELGSLSGPATIKGVSKQTQVIYSVQTAFDVTQSIKMAYVSLDSSCYGGKP